MLGGGGEWWGDRQGTEEYKRREKGCCGQLLNSKLNVDDKRKKKQIETLE